MHSTITTIGNPRPRKRAEYLTIIAFHHTHSQGALQAEL